MVSPEGLVPGFEQKARPSAIALRREAIPRKR
jgi:hypothetical protein